MRQKYTPVRDIRERVMLGMNQPRSGKRFGRMADAFRSDAAYWGERGQWYIVAAQTRDSDCLSRSNFAVLLKALGGEGEAVAVEEASHWACGWVQYLIVRPDNRKGLRIAIESHSAVADYPVLDETHFSEVEDEECSETWKNCFDRRERAKYLRDHLRDLAGHFRELREAVNGAWWAAAGLLPCPSELIY